MFKLLASILFFTGFMSLISNALECVFHTDPIHPVNPKFQDRNITGVKQYKCPGDDEYCVYFEGNLRTTGKNQKFSVRSCESDLMHYVGPIGETIGHKLEAKCQDEGVVEKRVGALSYYINCCKEPDCDNVKITSNSAAHQCIVSSLVFALFAMILATF